jgi:sugar lactone lactonase YvrE
VDVEGGVWVCVWGAGEIVRFVPDAKDGGAGVRDRVVRTPCSRPTSCCFGGGDAATRRTLFVTSCSLDDTVDAGATSVSVEEPDAGAVFAVDVGVEGVEVHAAAF